MEIGNRFKDSKQHVWLQGSVSADKAHSSEHETTQMATRNAALWELRGAAAMHRQAQAHSQQVRDIHNTHREPSAIVSYVSDI